jgi:hypothetical protein
MTSPDKTYWIRRKGSVGPNHPFGILLGKHRRGKKGMLFWVQKPAIAFAAVGGERLDALLAKPENNDCEAVEVVQQGKRKYHKEWVPNWVPVDSTKGQ